MRAALYLRVSTGTQTTDNQELILTEFLSKQNWTLSKSYRDVESGGTSDRPQFSQMMRDASKRSFDVLVFWSLDRLTREGAIQTLEYLNRLSGWGVGFRSYTEQYLDSCGLFKDAVIAILGTIAQQERIRLSERVKAGMDRARKQGKAIGKKPLQIDETHFRKACGLRTKEGNRTYSNQELAELFGISRASVFNLKRKWGVTNGRNDAPASSGMEP
jgi:DNA invertase Pin-like site-specific DNA recombinase